MSEPCPQHECPDMHLPEQGRGTFCKAVENVAVKSQNTPFHLCGMAGMAGMPQVMGFIERAHAESCRSCRSCLLLSTHCTPWCWDVCLSRGPGLPGYNREAYAKRRNFVNATRCRPCPWFLLPVASNNSFSFGNLLLSSWSLKPENSQSWGFGSTTCAGFEATSKTNCTRHCRFYGFSAPF